jgi:hypothetical protein
MDGDHPRVIAFKETWKRPFHHYSGKKWSFVAVKLCRWKANLSSPRNSTVTNDKSITYGIHEESKIGAHLRPTDQ